MEVCATIDYRMNERFLFGINLYFATPNRPSDFVANVSQRPLVSVVGDSFVDQTIVNRSIQFSYM